MNELKEKSKNKIIVDLIEAQDEIKRLQNEVDRYKHEYFSECDLREKVEVALGKACELLSLVVEDVSFNIIDGDHVSKTRCCFMTEEEWKEWLLNEVKENEKI